MVLIVSPPFVKTGFKNKFLDLVGVHPTIFFQHKIHRETLKNVIGINIFDRTSSYMDVSGESTIENGQYIVFDGMAPHSAGFQSCALVIDAVNEGYWFFCLDIAENENFFSHHPVSENINHDILHQKIFLLRIHLFLLALK